jgi:hypothetical protein
MELPQCTHSTSTVAIASLELLRLSEMTFARMSWVEARRVMKPIEESIACQLEAMGICEKHLPIVFKLQSIRSF